MNKMDSIKFLLRVVIIATVLTIVGAKGASAGSEESFRIILESVSEEREIKREVVEKNYASQFGKKDIPFLKEKALKNEGSMLAIELLGQIGGESAADALEEIALNVPYQYGVNPVFSIVDIRAVFLLENTKTPDLILRLEKIATAKHPERTIRSSAAALRWLGDSETAVKLRSHAGSVEYPDLKDFLKQSASAIEFKRNSLPQGISKEEWEGYEKQFWTNTMLVLAGYRSISISIDFSRAAEEINRYGRLPYVYLEKFDDKEWYDAQAIATYVIGLQKESDAIPVLIEKVKKDLRSEVAEAACFALAKIGGMEGTSALSELAASKDVKIKSDIARALAYIGSKQAADILLDMSQNEKDKRLSDLYKGEAEFILRTLQNKNK